MSYIFVNSSLITLLPLAGVYMLYHYNKKKVREHQARSDALEQKIAEVKYRLEMIKKNPY